MNGRFEQEVVGCESYYLVISGHFVQGKHKLNKRNEEGLLACSLLRHDGKGSGMKAQCLGFRSHVCCLHRVSYEHIKIKVCVVLPIWMLELSM